jgi:hypothetical protein
MTFTPESGEASENGQYSNSAITPFKIFSTIAVARIVRSFFLVFPPYSLRQRSSLFYFLFSLF